VLCSSRPRYKSPAFRGLWSPPIIEQTTRALDNARTSVSPPRMAVAPRKHRHPLQQGGKSQGQKMRVVGSAPEFAATPFARPGNNSPRNRRGLEISIFFRPGPFPLAGSPRIPSSQGWLPWDGNRPRLVPRPPFSFQPRHPPPFVVVGFPGHQQMDPASNEASAFRAPRKRPFASSSPPLERRRQGWGEADGDAAACLPEETSGQGPFLNSGRGVPPSPPSQPGKPSRGKKYRPGMRFASRFLLFVPHMSAVGPTKERFFWPAAAEKVFRTAESPEIRAR